jgi:hypothetical protein
LAAILPGGAILLDLLAVQFRQAAMRVGRGGEAACWARVRSTCSRCNM